jgi:hypothetical protein
VLFLIVLVAIGKIEAYAVLFGYFLETIIIGVFNIVKMYLSNKYHDKKVSTLFYIPFFIFHYGGFIAVQSIFLFAIFSISGTSFIKEPFHILQNFSTILKLEGMEIVVPLLISTQLMKFIFDFVLPRKFEKYAVKDIMFKPYFRIVIQQFTVIIGSFFIMFSEGSLVAAMLLILLRFIVDFFMVAIREDSRVLEAVVNTIYDGKVSKADLKKQLLLLTE